MKKHPPLIQHFIDVQTKYPDAIVATEVGGFFEIWQIPGEPIGHAIRASQLLETVLTRRNKADPDSPYMTGFPSYVGEDYFKRLVDLGETVVVVEQNIRGKKSDGNKHVTRDVSKILSPGITLDQLQESKNNFFCSLFIDADIFGLAFLDVSTGEVKITETNKEKALDLLLKMNPRELLITGGEVELPLKTLTHQNAVVIKKLAHCGQILSSTYEISNPSSNPSYPLISLGLEYYKNGALALGNLINYLASTDYNKQLLKKIARPELYNPKNYLHLPFNGFLSLEVFESPKQKESDYTLIKVLDRCKTAMGKRKLIQWMNNPLSDLDLIKERHDQVEEYLKKEKFFPELKNVYDIARVSRKMVLGRLLPHEINHLHQSISIVHDIFEEENIKLKKSAHKIKSLISENIDLEKSISATVSTDYDFLRGELAKEVQKELKAWKVAEGELLAYVDEIQKKLQTEKLRLIEKKESFFLIGPKSLKDQAKKAGIDLEVKANDAKITDEKFENLSLACFGYRQAFKARARHVWEEFQKSLHKTFGVDLLEISEEISQIDVLSCFALTAKERGYHRPKFVDKDSGYVKFKNMRHPVVEQAKNLQESYVANDIVLGEDKKTLVIYGANSAGKSTILKAVALNILMAQIGSFIACDKDSELTTFDNILTRITSFDSLSEGLSTFTQEMTELSVALRSRSQKSLFLFDEIGRGTSVEDGEAIAYGTLSYLNDHKNKSVTLFATHYHELYEQIKNLISVDVKNVHCYRSTSGELIFSRKLQDGRGGGSYGIEVARNCGLPEEILRMAENYAKDFAPLKISRYNKEVAGSLCPICEQNPVQQTHHLLEQKQGKVEYIEVDGAKKSIHHQSNLVMLCSSCHEKITRGEITVEKVQTGSNLELVVKTLKK